MLFTIEGAELLFFLCLLRLIQGYTCILLDEVRKVLCDNSQFLLQPFLLCAKRLRLTDRFNCYSAFYLLPKSYYSRQIQ